MQLLPKDTIETNDGARRLVYTAEQMFSGEVHAIIRATYTWAPSPDCLHNMEAWPSEEVDVMVDITTYNRMMERNSA